ncbi:MAG TPA: helix-turn-helix domain-containing protein [Acidobacteriota bacterium]|nr:helix-turn-helix domain-containing protein [Acidobacteriota bacterium]HNT17766.1 helix-turn-helix domain-containing protein [Acidobacteriota bacterium]
MSDNLFASEEKPFVISFSSPRGGVGTTLLAANSAIQLAKKGSDVLLIDAALSKASCHLALGVPIPERNISVLTTIRGSELKSAVTQASVANLAFVAGAPDNSDIANIPYLVKQKIISELRELPYDYVIIDAGSGTNNDGLDFALASDLSIFAVTPHPSSIEPFYRYVRALLHRLLLISLNKKRYQALNTQISFISPLPSLFRLEDTGEQDLQDVEKGLNSRRFGFVFTKLASEKDLRFGPQIESMILDFFRLPISFMGSLDWDQIAESAVTAMEAISKSHPICAYSLSVEKLVNRITRDVKEPPRPLPRSISDEAETTAYKIMDLSPKASPKEIQLAYSKKLESYLDNSFIPIGLMSKEEKEKKRDRLEEAYKLLINTQSRQKYDEELVRNGILSEEERISDYREPQQEAAPQAYESNGRDRDEEARRSEEEAGQETEITFYDGASLRKVRESFKISVEEIVAETNIRSWYIQSIEEERYDALPARIYLKGFLKQIAQYLRIPAEKVLRDYLERYDNWSGNKQE